MEMVQRRQKIAINLIKMQNAKFKISIGVNDIQFKDAQRHCVGLASAICGKLSSMWKMTSIITKRKRKLYRTFVTTVLMYGSECWCLRKEDERRILVAEMSCLRRIVKKSLRYRIRNEVIRKELTERYTSHHDQQRKTDMVWACGDNGRHETTGKALCCYMDGKGIGEDKQRHG